MLGSHGRTALLRPKGRGSGSEAVRRTDCAGDGQVPGTRAHAESLLDCEHLCVSAQQCATFFTAFDHLHRFFTAFAHPHRLSPPLIIFTAFHRGTAVVSLPLCVCTRAARHSSAAVNGVQTFSNRSDCLLSSFALAFVDETADNTDRDSDHVDRCDAIGNGHLI